MVIYLRHPMHGTKVAISDVEAEADEKLGWVRYEVGVLLTPDEPVSDTPVSEPAVSEPTKNALARPVGRPRKVPAETVI